MNRNKSIKGAIAIAACSTLGMTLLHCSQPPGVVGAEENGGASGQGGSSTSPDDASAGGSAGDQDAAVTINLDVIPASWGPSDAPPIPDIPPAPTLDSNCGIITSSTTRQLVDVLLVLDRSASMDYSIDSDCYCSRTTAAYGSLCADTTNCTTRWNSVEPAVTTTLANSKYVNWGLKFFPSPDSNSNCGVTNAIEVPVGADTATDINAQIAAATLSLGTPTAAAITVATSYLQGLGDSNPKFILVATDGEPNCGGGNINTDDVAGASDAATAAAAAGFPVYVIGIGPNLGNLTKLAQAGGTTDFYPVASPQDLADALSSISKLVGSCDFKSDQPPPDANNVAVYVNKQQVAQDDNNGWKYGATTQDIQLTGSYCDQITSGVDTDVQILFGCEGAPPFPTVIQ